MTPLQYIHNVNPLHFISDALQYVVSVVWIQLFQLTMASYQKGVVAQPDILFRKKRMKRVYNNVRIYVL